MIYFHCIIYTCTRIQLDPNDPYHVSLFVRELSWYYRYVVYYEHTRISEDVKGSSSGIKVRKAYRVHIPHRKTSI
jgi:hypothetical protein